MVQASTVRCGLGLAVLLMAACGGGSGAITSPSGTSTPASPTGTPTPPGTGTVVTVSASGLSPQEIRVPVGARVTFTNTDTRAHDFSGGPDPSRPECPEVDAAGFVAPGQSRQTAVFATARTCVYHDHTYLGVAAFIGRIVIE